MYPNTHYLIAPDRFERSLGGIEAEMEERLATFKTRGQLLEAQRLEQRTRFDLEMMRAMGYCHGIENYSRHLTGRSAGDPPPTLLDYFPEKLPIGRRRVARDHSTNPGHVEELILANKASWNDGFRLPSAFDNRPLKFRGSSGVSGRAIYVVGDPWAVRSGKTAGVVVENIIRPTGLRDTEISAGRQGAVDDLLAEIRKRAARERECLSQR